MTVEILPFELSWIDCVSELPFARLITHLNCCVEGLGAF